MLDAIPLAIAPAITLQNASTAFHTLNADNRTQSVAVTARDLSAC